LATSATGLAGHRRGCKPLAAGCRGPFLAREEFAALFARPPWLTFGGVSGVRHGFDFLDTVERKHLLANVRARERVARGF